VIRRPARAIDRDLDLGVVTHDTAVTQEQNNLALGELGHDANIEVGERATKIVAFGLNRSPAQSRLKTLERDRLEKFFLILRD
jgi:hypothetical protein